MRRGLAISSLLTLAVPVTSYADDHLKTRIGADFDVGYSMNSGDGEDGSTRKESESSHDQKKVNMYMHFDHGKTKAKIKMDLLKLGEGEIEDSSFEKADFLDDAWVQHAFHDAFKVKWGYEWTFNNSYGLHSWHLFTGNLDQEKGTPKLEFSGKMAGFYYGLQTWEDVANVDQSVEDLDTGLFNNMALKLQYNMAMLEAGLIYKVDAGYQMKDASGNDVGAEVKDEVGTQIYAKYIHGDMFNVWLRLTQKQINDDQEGGTQNSFGFAYTGMGAMGIHLAYHIPETIAASNAEGDAKAVTSSIIDFKFDYAVNQHLKYFVQYIAYGEDYEGKGNKAYNDIVLGMQGRY